MLWQRITTGGGDRGGLQMGGRVGAQLEVQRRVFTVKNTSEKNIENVSMRGGGG